MRYMGFSWTDLGRTTAVGAVLALLFVGLAAAQDGPAMVSIQGTVHDMDGDPIVGARVVYRLLDSEGVFISRSTDAAGVYDLELPSGERCRPVAVVVEDGTRVDLGEVAPAHATEGMTQQITIDRPKRWNPSAVVQNFVGSDRLFHSFVEDTAIVDGGRFETQFQRQEGDFVDRGLMNVIVSKNFKSIPVVEFGAKISYVGINTTSGATGKDIGDTDLWAKYVLGVTENNRNELAFGATVTLPTGSDDEGTGFDSTMSRFFFAARREFASGVFTGNLTLAFNGDGRFLGSALDGQTTFGAHFGVIVPWTYRLAFVGELDYEKERFEGFGDVASILGGINMLLKEGSIRGAVSLGLQDGSPDVELTIGYAFPF